MGPPVSPDKLYHVSGDRKWETTNPSQQAHGNQQSSHSQNFNGREGYGDPPQEGRSNYGSSGTPKRKKQRPEDDVVRGLFCNVPGHHHLVGTSQGRVECIKVADVSEKGMNLGVWVGRKKGVGGDSCVFVISVCYLRGKLSTSPLGFLSLLSSRHIYVYCIILLESHVVEKKMKRNERNSG